MKKSGLYTVVAGVACCCTMYVVKGGLDCCWMTEYTCFKLLYSPWITYCRIYFRIPVLIGRGTLKPSRICPYLDLHEKRESKSEQYLQELLCLELHRSWRSPKCQSEGTSGFPLCIEVCSHKKLVMPNYSYCLINEQRP